MEAYCCETLNLLYIHRQKNNYSWLKKWCKCTIYWLQSAQKLFLFNSLLNQDRYAVLGEKVCVCVCVGWIHNDFKAVLFVSSHQVNWQQERFQEISSKLGHFLKQAGFKVHILYTPWIFNSLSKHSVVVHCTMYLFFSPALVFCFPGLGCLLYPHQRPVRREPCNQELRVRTYLLVFWSKPAGADR